MKSSSVAARLKQEKQDDCKFHEGDLNSLELRLGISSDNGQTGGATSPWLGAGVHPWSSAARQGKADFEQVHQRPNECAVQRENRPAATSQPVGWPPVCSFRKNLSTPKPADAEDLMSKVKLCSDEGHGFGDANQERSPSTMFVKVNLEGYAVGRKIDLKAHRSYDSLSQALQSMFHGFLSGHL
uniref:Auxin-responsive protein n=1 Tax=Leersia perrieri TaxID=77586 RepID=A0A0D9X3N4_9ORYZ